MRPWRPWRALAAGHERDESERGERAEGGAAGTGVAHGFRASKNQSLVGVSWEHLRHRALMRSNTLMRHFMRIRHSADLA